MNSCVFTYKKDAELLHRSEIHDSYWKTQNFLLSQIHQGTDRISNPNTREVSESTMKTACLKQPEGTCAGSRGAAASQH